MDFIIFEVIGHLGKITLHRPQALNAMNLTMLRAIYQQLRTWENDPHISAVLICSSEEKAFCAGGDIREIYDAYHKKNYLPEVFFEEEYRLNQYIKFYPKPYIALINGITMGGGVGISLYAKWCIAAPNLIFAMPETTIGYFPDVGSSYFLSRLPGEIGLFLGLTGTRLNAAETYHLKLIHTIVPYHDFTKISHALSQSSPKTIGEFLRSIEIAPTNPLLLTEHRTLIDACFSANTIEEIFHRLKKYPSDFAEKILIQLQQKSPTSLKITLKQLRLGKQLSFTECMAMEYRLAQSFMQSHDFFEGVRAILIDKDQKPHWQPARLEEVSEETVAQYFLTP